MGKERSKYMFGRIVVFVHGVFQCGLGSEVGLAQEDALLGQRQGSKSG